MKNMMQRVISCTIFILLFFPVIKTSQNYRLTANVSTDPKTKNALFHLRYFWAHRDDKAFQAKMKGVSPFPPDEPAWKPTTRGIALNLQDLKEFLEADICGLLLNTIVKKEIKEWVKEVVLYICNNFICKKRYNRFQWYL